MPDGRKVSVTTAIIGEPKDFNNIGVHIEGVFEYQRVHYNTPGNPEIFGIWMCFCDIYKNHPHLLQNKIALITDTEYSTIESWQKRESPFFENWNMPDGIDFFYASTDAGTDEFLINNLMKKCDQLSNEKIKEIFR